MSKCIKLTVNGEESVIEFSSFEDYKTYLNNNPDVEAKLLENIENGVKDVNVVKIESKSLSDIGGWVETPVEPTQQYYEGDITPEPNTIFVFGSNPEGRHGAGSAKVAKDKFGAKQGQGEGLQGDAYALPTKDLKVKEDKGYKSISPEQITNSVKQLYEVAKQNPDKQFKVAYRNTTERSLNGYTGLEMIEMFNNAGIRPNNVIFSKEWVDTGKVGVFSPGTFGSDAKGLIYNKEQQKAIDETVEFIKSGDPKDYWLVQGKAGTGKTTIAQEIAKMFPDKSIFVSAISHKAKGVIKDKFVGTGIKAEYHSIAGLLGMKMNLETGEFNKDKNDFSPSPIGYADIVFIDEASMINEEVIELIFEQKPTNTKVVFLGDIGQLPPIRTVKNPYYSNKVQLFNKKSPVFDSKNKSLLEERVRQGESSPILPFADYFWDNSQKETSDSDPAPKESRVNNITKNGALLFTNKFNDIKDSVIDSFKKAVDTKNPNHIKIVTYRNKTREAINKFTHDSVFGSNSDEFNKGELIIFNDTYGEIENSTETQVEGVSNELIDSNGLSFVEVEAVIDKTLEIFPVILSKSKGKFNNIVSQKFKDAFALKNQPDRRAYTNALKEAWRFKNQYANVDYGYAITSHKSQGSTYDIVVVHESDIMSVNPISDKTKSESIYTALTRPKNVAIVISNVKVPSTDINIEELDSSIIQGKVNTSEDTSNVEVESKPQQEDKTVRIEKDPKHIEFNKLPDKSNTPTMTYAGIGSRETPPHVLEKMTQVSKRLEELNFTLRSGGAKGADTAFESGTSKKEVFKGFDKAGEREVKIAHELHPNLKGAMEGSKRRAVSKGKNGDRSSWAVENLMARNTNQVFGKNLDTPVDFVLFYAKETNNPLRPKGGTGQAVEMARRKGIPTINMSEPGWEGKIKQVLDSLKQQKDKPSQQYYEGNIEPETSDNIYEQLGDKTKQGNVVIKSVYQQEGVKYAKSIGGVFSMRVNNSDKHFGNPFSSVKKEIDKGLIATTSTRDSVEKYIDWVLNSNEDRAKWIREQLDSGKLKNKPIVYYKELNEPSHATALDYLINNWKGSKPETLTTIQSKDVKAKIKHKHTDSFIGYGDNTKGSSTQHYRSQYPNANKDTYIKGEKVFVSIPGRRGDAKIRKDNQDKTIRLAIKAIEQGAILYTDSIEYLDEELHKAKRGGRFEYNEGERRLNQNLTAKGYEYKTVTLDGQRIGVWSKPQQSNDTSVEGVIKTTTLSQQDIESRLLRLSELEAELESLNNEMSNEKVIADNWIKISKESAEKETGLKVGNTKDINTSMVSVKGVSVGKASELFSANHSIDEIEAKNIIIDILSKGSLKNYKDENLSNITDDLEIEIKRIQYELKDAKEPSSKIKRMSYKGKDYFLHVDTMEVTTASNLPVKEQIKYSLIIDHLSNDPITPDLEIITDGKGHYVYYDNKVITATGNSKGKVNDFKKDKHNRIVEHARIQSQYNEQVRILNDLERNDIMKYKDDYTDSMSSNEVSQGVEHFIEVFKKKGVDINVRYDETIDSPAYINYDKQEIVFNPNKINDEIVTHEFGHLFTAIVGYDNPIIKKGYDLVDSIPGLKNNIAKKYADEIAIRKSKYLMEGYSNEEIKDMIDMYVKEEALVTLIGQEGGKILSSEVSENMLQRIKSWLSSLFEYIKKEINRLAKTDIFTVNEVKELTKDLIQGNFDINTTTTFTYDFFIDKAINKMNNFQTQALTQFYTDEGIEVGDKVKALNLLKRDKDKPEAVNEFINTTLIEFYDLLDKIEDGYYVDEYDINRILSEGYNFYQLFKPLFEVNRVNTTDSLKLKGERKETHKKLNKFYKEIKGMSNVIIEKKIKKYNEEGSPVNFDDLVDDNVTNRWLNSMNDSKNKYLKLVMKNYEVEMNKSKQSATEKTNDFLIEYERFVREGGDVKNYIDESTGRIITKIKEELLEIDKADAINEINLNKHLYGESSKEYLKLTEIYTKTFKDEQWVVDEYGDERYEAIKDDWFYNTLRETLQEASNGLVRNHIEKGFLPAVSDEKSNYIKDIADIYGNKLKYNKKTGEVTEYYMTRLNQDDTIRIDKKFVENIKAKNNGDIEATLEEIKGLITDNRLTMKNNLAKHAESLNMNVEETVPEFIRQAYNTTSKRKLEHLYNIIGEKMSMSKYKNSRNRYDDWMKMVFYEDFENVDKLNTVNLNKATKIMEGLTAKLGIGFNILAGVANINYGLVSNMIEASGGEHYTVKDFYKANKDYFKDFMVNYKEKSSPKSSTKSGAVIKYFDLISHEFVSESWFDKNAFMLQNIGEDMLQNTQLIAMMKKYKYNEMTGIIELSDTNIPTVWDKIEIDMNGKLITEIPKEELMLFKNKVVGVLQKTHGIYNQEDKGAINKFALGRLAMQFRGWMKSGIDLRFKAKEFNERTGQYEEGMYRSSYNFIKDVVKDMVKLRFNAIHHWNELETYQKANIIKTLTEFSFFITSYLAISLIGGEGGGGDEDNWFTLMALYSLHRVNNELSNFYPQGMFREGKDLLQSPVTAFRLMNDVIDVGQGVVMYPFDNKIDLAKEVIQITPGVNQLYRLRPEGLQNSVKYQAER